MGGVGGLGAAITCAGGLFAYLALRTLAAPVPLALTGMALYLVLPGGTTAMRPMTEGLTSR
ncbi:Integral membrane protein OS=Streptomyces tendae OX=1932 GN=F3L20_28185 PE=4 SV=1 [Streptomyces tendae]